MGKIEKIQSIFLEKNPPTICFDRKIPTTLWFVLSIFLLKAFILAFWVIPLWDIQDEPGHYSYILDIANGKGLPVMGEALFDESVKADWLNDTWKDHYSLNWIAQHPPLYYMVNATILSAARLFSSNSEFLFRITRLLSVVSGTLALFVFYRIFIHVTRNKKISLFLVTGISLIPMFGFQAAGTTHDQFLSLLCALAILYWVKFIITRNMKHSILMACFLSLAAVTKSTSLLLFVPLVGISFFYIDERNLQKRLIYFVLISTIAMILPGLWMIRSYIHYGVFLSTFHNVVEHFDKAKILKTNLHQYLTSTLIIENLYSTFLGEFGWTGRGGKCMVLLIKNSTQLITLYYCATSLFLFFSMTSYIKTDQKVYNKKLPFNTLFAGLVISYFIVFSIPVKENSYLLPIMYAVMLSILTFSLQIVPLLICDNSKYLSINFLKINADKKELIENKFIYLSLFVCFFYTLIFIIELNSWYEKYHMLRADHGRYWFPIIPLLACSFVYPTFKVINLSKSVLVGIISAMFINEILIYTQYVIPFFSS